MNEYLNRLSTHSVNYSRNVGLQALTPTEVESQTELLNDTYVKEEAKW